MNRVISTLATAASTVAIGRLLRPRRSSIAVTVLGYSATFLAGVAVGAVAGFMFAPKSGRDLRADIKTGAHDVGEGIRSTASAVSHAAQRAASAAQESRVDQAADTVAH